MVPYTLPLSLIFFTRIITSSAQILVVTNVSLNSSGSATIGVSNGTVILLNQTDPPIIDQQNGILNIGSNGTKIIRDINIGQENNSLIDSIGNPILNVTSNSSDDNLIKTNRIQSALENFPSDFMSESMRDSGGIILHILILAYFCLALGVVCDVYFLPALEFISNALKLPSDIAGATFMAIGTSAPELFTSIIGVFVSEDDIGTGTILGTAVFNLIVIPATCGFAVLAFCPKTPSISKFPILRDSIFYIITIVTLILCIKDNKVDWVESLTLISLFMVYLVLMYFNAQFSHLITPENEEEIPLLKGDDKNPLVIAQEQWNKIEANSVELENSSSRKRASSTTRRMSFKEIIDEDEDWVEKNCFFKYLLFPMTILFRFTLPKATKFCFVITFTMSVIWIGSLTYVCVWMVTIIGYTFGIPDTVAGLTILAAGTSVPELISSVIVVKKAGLANMAICNSIGSNIFDILFCLGIPWLLKSIILMFRTGSLALVDTAIPIQSTALPFTSMTLLLTVFALIATFQLTHWKLGLTVGITCSVIYLLFVSIASVLEIQMA